MVITDKKVNYLVVDTTAFIQNLPLHDIAEQLVTIQEVINEITNRRQLRRLVALPYNLVVKDVFPENIHVITEFSKKTGDYLNLSATDIKVMALTYQLEKEHVGIDHLRKEPITKSVISTMSKTKNQNINVNLTGFFLPRNESKENTLRTTSLTEISNNISSKNQLENELELLKLEDMLEHQEKEDTLRTASLSENCAVIYEPESLNFEETNADYILSKVKESDTFSEGSSDDDNDCGWITPVNVKEANKHTNGNLEDKYVKVACITTDFAIQNVLRQMNLNISTFDGKIIKHLKTYILRCYSCFKTTGIMTKEFCPNCGNNTLKRVSVSVDADGKQKIHINARHPLTARGKKYSLPTAQGGKHSQNPILAPDQPLPDQRPTRLARMKNNPLSDDFVAGYSPFIMRDINSKSAQLGIRSSKEVKHWMRKNPNETRRKRK